MKIGIIDSGVGGLTVLFYLMEKLKFNYYYIADESNCPYGNKSKEEIIILSDILVSKLINNFDIDILVIACNTVASSAYKYLKNKYKNLIIINIIEVTARHVKGNNIGVIATKRTVKSNKYKKLLSNYIVKQKQVPIFVDIIENISISNQIRNFIVKYELKDFLKGVDSLVLGCTHYPILIKHIKEIYSGRIITSNYPIYKELLKYKQSKKSSINIYTTSNCNEFRDKIKYIFDFDIDVYEI